MNIPRAAAQVGGKQHLGCAKCNRLLPDTEFYVIRGKSKPHSWCKLCYKDWRKARRAAGVETSSYVRRIRERRPPAPPVEHPVDHQVAFLQIPAANAAAFHGFPLVRGGMPA